MTTARLLLLTATLVSATLSAAPNEATIFARKQSFDRIRVYEAYQLGSEIHVVRVESDFIIADGGTVFSDPFPLDGPSIAISKIITDSDRKLQPLPRPIPEGAIPLSRRSQWPGGGEWQVLGTWAPDPDSPWAGTPQFGYLWMADYPWVWWHEQGRWIYVSEAGVVNEYNAYWFYVPSWGGWFYTSKEFPHLAYSWPEQNWVQLPIPESWTRGTVRFTSVEGGCWFVETASGQLEPLELAEEFRIDGLEVAFVAEDLPGFASICQVGTIVEITRIRRADASPWWAGTEDLGDGWRNNWIGNFNTTPDPWIYHLDHGWFFVIENSNATSLWIYTLDNGWLWTGDEAYPYFYRNSTGGWIYYAGVLQDGLRWFNDLTTGAWESFAKAQ